jgi:hypothetical protein
VAALLSSERYAELDKLANEYRTSRARTESGLWYSTLFYVSLNRALYGCEDACEAMLDRWLAQAPESIAAHIAYAKLYLVRAQAAYRTAHRDPSKDKAKWKPFYLQIAFAREYLQKHKSATATDPEWYEAMIEVARAEDWPQASFSELLDNAIDLEPLYYQNYFKALDYYLYGNEGDADRLEALARKAVERTRKTDGSGMYARVYWFAYQAQYGDRVFSDTKAVWADMKQGMEDVLRLYPDQWNINNFAYFACLAGDYSTAKALIAKIEGEPLAAVWGWGWRLERCKFGL